MTESDLPSLHTCTVEELLNMDLHIPDYQRPYVWTTVNVGELIGDIKSYAPNQSGSPQSDDVQLQDNRYRIGSIILHNETATDKPNEFDIVDGQQRIITLVLLYLLCNESANRSAACKAKDLSITSGRLDISRNHILENYHYGKQAIPEQERRPFLQKMLQGCSVDVITTHDISQAFQLFDSQNDRGKPLDPTDLLKAYHLHELDVQGDDSASQDNQDISSQWMDSATISRIRELFNDHLFRIKRWSMKQSVLDGFSASNINMFKGLSLAEAERNDTPWTKPYRILEERYCSAENPQLKTAEDYPFQIDMSFASGKRFFDMTQHYLDLAENCGIFLHDSAENNDSFLETCDWFVKKAIKDSPNTPMEHIRAELCRIDLFREMLSLRNSNWHYKTTCNLFLDLIMYYIDRFGTDHLNEFVNLAFRYAGALRIASSTCGITNIDTYVLAQQPQRYLPNRVNLFSIIRLATSARDVLHTSLDTIELNNKANSTDDKKWFDTIFYKTARFRDIPVIPWNDIKQLREHPKNSEDIIKRFIGKYGDEHKYIREQIFAALCWGGIISKRGAKKRWKYDDKRNKPISGREKILEYISSFLHSN